MSQDNLNEICDDIIERYGLEGVAMVCIKDGNVSLCSSVTIEAPDDQAKSVFLNKIMELVAEYTSKIAGKPARQTVSVKDLETGDTQSVVFNKEEGPKW